MTRKTDMAARYAAAHARREQRRKQSPTRQYLPLGEGGVEQPSAGNDQAAGGMGRAATATLQSRLPAIDYSYLKGDLIRIAVLATTLFAGMILLSFVIK